MLKEISYAAVACSLAALVACSSSSGTTGSSEGDDAASKAGGDASTDDSDASGNPSPDASGAACENPLQQISAITGKTIPAACSTCVDGKCALSVQTCSTSSCLDCGPGVYECAMSSCSSSCFPVSDAGATKSSDAGGASDGGAACASLMSCSGCTLVNVTMPGSLATCMQAIASNQTAVCQAYLSGIHAVSPTTCP
jgi:hypothetical protein